MTRKYLVWFRANRLTSETIVLAASKAEAVALFAQHNHCVPSSYIAARLAV